METPELTAQQRIWPFRDKLLHNDGRNMRRLNSFHSTHVRTESLKDVATTFVQKNLGVSSNNTQYRNPAYLLQISYERNFTEQTPLTQYQDFTETLPVHFRQPALGHFNNAVTYAQNLAYSHPSLGGIRLGSDSQPPSGHTTNSTLPTGAPPPCNRANDFIAARTVIPLLPTTARPSQSDETETSPILPVRMATPNQWIEIDTLLSLGKKVLHYRVVNHFVKQLKQKSPNQVAIQLHELVLEVGNLHPNHSLPLQKRFIDSRSSLRSSRHVFGRYLNTFCKCLILCHGADIDRFICFHDKFDPHHFHTNRGCAACRNKKF
jgi:hypothetical protein